MNSGWSTRSSRCPALTKLSTRGSQTYSDAHRWRSGPPNSPHSGDSKCHFPKPPQPRSRQKSAGDPASMPKRDLGPSPRSVSPFGEANKHPSEPVSQSRRQIPAKQDAFRQTTRREVGLYWEHRFVVGVAHAIGLERPRPAWTTERGHARPMRVPGGATSRPRPASG